MYKIKTIIKSDYKTNQKVIVENLKLKKIVLKCNTMSHFEKRSYF